MLQNQEEKLDYEVEREITRESYVIEIPYTPLELNNEIEIVVHSNNTKRLKCILSLFILIITLPITICDLLFAYTDTSCVYINLEKSNISIKYYLLVCGYTNILLLIYNIYIICFYIESYIEGFVNTNYIYLFVFDILQFILKLFLIVWNIIGIAIFWSAPYIRRSCRNVVYNYLFATIIIKTIFTIISYFKEKNKRFYID